MLLDSRVTQNISLGLALDRDSSQFTKDYEQLCSLLCLPTSALGLLRSQESVAVLRHWLKVRMRRNSSKKEGLENLEQSETSETDHEEVKEPKSNSEVTCARRVFLSAPFEFVKLPDLFQEVYQHLVRQYCDTCESTTPETGICLTCGQVICAGIKHLLGRRDHHVPNSLNVFVTHAETCGGIFLVMRLSTILLFRGRRISVWNSIYLDEHGEEDLELKRGKALYLNQSRLEQLLKLFITQNMDHDTRILSKTQFLGISDA